MGVVHLLLLLFFFLRVLHGFGGVQKSNLALFGWICFLFFLYWSGWCPLHLLVNAFKQQSLKMERLHRKRSNHLSSLIPCMHNLTLYIECFFNPSPYTAKPSFISSALILMKLAMASLSYFFIVVTLFIIPFFGCCANAQLSPNFYARTCPSLPTIVRNAMSQAVAREARMAASILRLFFHDCFVNVRTIQ
ncbi:hypothetical protein GBA52_010238 [Prunus armeniaca]|nr:hypothetical protein GBA52_010238 [Prunus armeniaca]